MKLNRIICSCLLIFILGIIYDISAKEKNVVFTIKSNRDNIEVGDKLQIYCNLQNLDDKAYRFSNNNIHLFKIYKSFFDEKGNGFPVRSDRIYSMKMAPFKEDFYELKTNEKKQYLFEFTLEQGIKFISGKIYWGKYLYNARTDTYLILKNTRKIYIKVEYNLTEVEEKYGEKEYKFGNLYKNPLVSNEIAIRIN